MYSIASICEIVTGKLLQPGEQTIEHLVFDSRRIQQPHSSLFFALRSSHNNGHRYIAEAYQKGVRAFVVSELIVLDDAAVILVEDSLAALQQLAAHHRRRYSLPVIGITGSNGKTIVKEWLHQLLEDRFSIVRSPKSFNSQIGVPLSVWEIKAHHTLGIFEAGISRPGEMENLQRIIQPTIGVLTNIGEAHSEGFASDEQKLQEKLKLFAHAEIVIGQADLLAGYGSKKFTWGRLEGANVIIRQVKVERTQTVIGFQYNNTSYTIAISFTDEASIENAITCLCVLIYLGVDVPEFENRFAWLHPVDMRLQLCHAINHCLLINDSYSADPTSLRIALDFLQQQSSGLSRTLILSDFFESGKPEPVLYEEIAQLINHHHIHKLIVIGDKIGAAIKDKLDPAIVLDAYATTADFIGSFRSSSYHNEIILLKGARKFNFERIALLFEQKLHGTVLQINLSALTHNLKEYQQHLLPSTRIMAMVKAFSYGSGGAEIASVLQFHNTAYLGVAYADEGIELVKAGITLPIMVMNAEPSSFAAIVDHSLQPVIYSLPLLYRFEAYIKEQALTEYPIHLEIETGMNRLGFDLHEVEEAARYIASGTTLSVQSVFSHLAASEEPEQDAFTQMQAERLGRAVGLIRQQIAYPFLTHIANSAAIIRHPHLQMDMVRLGIGLYGIEPDAEEKLHLEPVATLHSTIAQIKTLKKGESVSYNRKGMVHRDSRIATVRIGYADGYSRQFGNGVGKMLVRNQLVPVIGTVCMDMTMIDVTDVEGVREGDDVIVFGKELPVQEVARWINTIPYEIMTSVSQRVKRVYYYE